MDASTLFDGNEDGVTKLPVNGLGEMALAVRVLDQDHLAGADDAGLAVAGLDGNAGVEVDDVLPARRGMPPILLLDEVAAHLDAARRDALFARLAGLGGQIWMTGTDKDAFAGAFARGAQGIELG